MDEQEVITQFEEIINRYARGEIKKSKDDPVVLKGLYRIINEWEESQHPRDEKGRWTKDNTAIQKKKDSLIPISIKGEDIPKFESKSELNDWVKGIFKELGSVNILDTNTKVILTSSGANRETSKRRSVREENKAVFQQFKDVVEKSIKIGERKADDRHIHDQDIYFNKIELDGKPYNVELIFDYFKPNKEYRYAGHKVINGIGTAPSYLKPYYVLQATGATIIITDNSGNYNPSSKEMLKEKLFKEEKTK